MFLTLSIIHICAEMSHTVCVVSSTPGWPARANLLLGVLGELAFRLESLESVPSRTSVCIYPHQASCSLLQDAPVVRG